MTKNQAPKLPVTFIFKLNDGLPDYLKFFADNKIAGTNEIQNIGASDKIL